VYLFISSLHSGVTVVTFLRTTLCKSNRITSLSLRTCHHPHHSLINIHPTLPSILSEPLDSWRWIGCPETSVTTNQRCLTFQKSEDLMYTEAESWPRLPWDSSIIVFPYSFPYLSDKLQKLHRRKMSSD
jgi:hypothetical protein